MLSAFGEVDAAIERGDESLALSALIRAHSAIGTDQANLRVLLTKASSARSQMKDADKAESCDDLIRQISLQLGERLPERRTFREGMPVSTSNEIPGWEVSGYVGEARPRT